MGAAACRYEVYCNTSDFIREHIFPGGHLPSLGAVVEAIRGTGLAVRDTHDIGPDYAITLRQWRQAWEERKEDVLRLGYSERFWRKYRCGAVMGRQRSAACTRAAAACACVSPQLSASKKKDQAGCCAVHSVQAIGLLQTPACQAIRGRACSASKQWTPAACSCTHDPLPGPRTAPHRFYFVFCEAAFDARYIHNYHLLFVKDPSSGELLSSQLAPAAAVDGASGVALSASASAVSQVCVAAAPRLRVDPTCCGTALRATSQPAAGRCRMCTLA